MMCELVQDSRRAGATRLEMNYEKGDVTIRDDGDGLA